MPTSKQDEFYRSFLMGRALWKPEDFGIAMEKDALGDMVVEEFNSIFRGQLSVDELVLRPRTAMAFCDQVRLKHGFHDLPDDIILRTLMNRRKHP